MKSKADEKPFWDHIDNELAKRRQLADAAPEAHRAGKTSRYVLFLQSTM